MKNMNLRNATLCLLIGMVYTSCTTENYKKTEDGVIVLLNKSTANTTSQVRLQVLGEKLIRVSATPDKKFSERESLIITPQEKQFTDFKIDENDNDIILTTSEIKAHINKSNGEVCFTDIEGNIILEEKSSGGKSYTPITVEGKKQYSVQQIFESKEDEAFYGLGQHQADEFNYKGKNEELFQYNTKVSVPFVISNKNYGILWDSYSLCRFGDPRDYSQLNSVFELYNKNGVKGELTGTYIAKNGEFIIRGEDSIYYENQKSLKNLPKDFNLMGSNVVYEGEIEPKESGEFKFILYYAGYIKVFLDNEEIVSERWRTAWNPNSYKFSANLEKNKKVALRIEWIPDGGESYCGLRVLSPVDEKEQNRMSWWSEMNPEIDYYFISGDNMDEVISGYRTLTGKAPIMPKWAMGYWQSRERYKTQDEVINVMNEFRERKIPIDNIVVDWNYWPEDSWGSHDFDLERFPNPKGMIDSIHTLNGRVMISVWPKFYCTTENFKEFDKKGWMYQQAVKDSIRDWVGPGYVGSFYDAYSAEARDLFWKQMKEKLYVLGIDAWWMDASEPNVRDCTDLEYRKALCGPTALGSSTEYFNAYALMNAEAIYNGQRNEDNDKRVFLLTRSGFAGLQKYSTATWSGDIATRWEDMKAQISAGLNFALSGIPYWTMDIGGFCVESRYERGQYEYNNTGKENSDYKEWRELNTRWYQFGAFSPLYRAHGQYPFREVWNIAPENHPAYKSIVYYTKLRYNMLPYIYSLAGMTYLKDYTIMRPLVMDYSNDSKVNNIGDQYLFGPSLMVCPVYEYQARDREIYLPENTQWYDFYTGKQMPRGKQIVDAPYERIPLYVSEGSIIPFGPDMQYSDEKDADQISLYVYKGKDAEFEIYEDENVNYNYEKNKYSIIPIIFFEDSSTLVIDDRKGEFDGMLKDRTFNIVVVDKNNPRKFDVNNKGIQIKYDGKKQIVKI